jgi:hypothetical protein
MPDRGARILFLQTNFGEVAATLSIFCFVLWRRTNEIGFGFFSFFFFKKMSRSPPSLDFYSLCEIASFLTLKDFKNFISVCPAWSACRHDIETVMRVLRNASTDLNYVRQTMSPTIYGRHLKVLRPKTVQAQLDVLLNENDHIRLRLLAPLLVEQTWQMVLGQCGNPKLKSAMQLIRLAELDSQPEFRRMLKRVVKSPDIRSDRVLAMYVLPRRIPDTLADMDEVVRFMILNPENNQLDFDSFSDAQCDLAYTCLANRAGGLSIVDVLRKISQRRLPSEAIRK